MTELEWVDFKDMKASAMKDAESTREYEALREEFELSREVIELRKQRNMTQKELAAKAIGAQTEVHLRSES